MARNLPAAPPPRRALAVLEWLIAEAEHEARRRAAGDGDSAQQRERLGAACDRLTLLRHSRHCLLTGEPPGASH
jgi:hypothetical protein